MKYIIIIAALVVVAIIYFAFSGSKKLIDKSIQTYSGKISDYKGNKKLIVAFTASWASVWVATSEEMKKIDREKFDLLILDAEIDANEIKEYNVDFFPTVAFIENGKISNRVQNLMSIKQIDGW